MEARPRRESDAFTSPITVAKQNRDFEPAERWESPWPSLPEPLPVESAGFETTIALRERDRWQRLVREQESA
jgi:hypothetical protein